MSQALYRKWRPRLWAEVVGQEHIVQTLQNAIRGGRIGHAYLFAGPRGTGKTTTARLLAKAVNCQAEDPAARPCDQCEHCKAVNEGRYLDLIEIDAASNTSVDDVRDLRDKINYSPNQGTYKVYIIDEVHMLSTAAFNALLKTLEEPPPHAIFILATTEVHKIPATVLSRCQRHEFRRIPVVDIVNQLKKMCAEEKIEADPEALVLIARQATGAMRDAISLLDQLSSTGERINLEMAQRVLGTATSQSVVALMDAVLSRDAAAGLDQIHTALDSGSDPRQFARQVVDYLRGLMLVKLENPEQVEATAELLANMKRQAGAFRMAQLLDTLRLFNSAASDVRSGWQPGLLLELALAQAVGYQETAPVPEAPPVRPSEPMRSAPVEKPAVSAPVKTGSAPSPAKPEPAPAAAVSPTAADPAAPKGATPAPAGISPQTIAQNWAKIRAAVKKRRSQTEGLLNSLKQVNLRDGVVVLAFASEVLKSKMEMPENLNIARQAIFEVLGVELPVKCVVVSTKGESGTAEADIDQDSIVGTALSLGGKIVHRD